MSAVAPSALSAQGHSAGARQSARQTRTNPSRTSKTLGRSSFAYGHSSMMDAASSPVPHGFYPALTHFTDAITALPREFRRHNSLLKEVDAKAWALEDNLLQLLKASSEAQSQSQGTQYPGNSVSAQTFGGVRDEVLTQVSLVEFSPAFSDESTNRRVLFDRVRHTLSDLMMTADEKNHVISNANDELDRQLMRLDTVFPFIAGEISDEARLGSLNHWAYSNQNATKTTAHERPRREVASNKDLVHALHDAEVASRSEARREAVLARRQRRAHVDSDMDDARAAGSRKGQSSKNRVAGDQTSLGHNQPGSNTSSTQAKRRKVERPVNVEACAAMERSASGAGASGRAVSKDAIDVTKKRSRAPNSNSAARKRNNTGVPTADSPVITPSPLIGTAAAAAIPRSGASPGPGSSRPQSSRTQQTSAQAKQRPSSSASNRVPSSGKTTELKAPLKETPSRTELPFPNTHREPDTLDTEPSAPLTNPREDPDTKPTESNEPTETPAPIPPPAPTKGRSSKTATPVLASAEPVPAQGGRTRPTRNTDPAPKRSHKKNGSTAPVVPPPPPPPVSDPEESLHEGDDEDEEGEPRYCYCNEISFGEMVACDNDACPREWFHLSCVGLTKPPGRNVKWYCNECKENMRRSRNGR
ncbi:putative PHD finger domain protein (Ing1) [Aspergillus undulatus]|uniref:putative PHD finger domain protein (Ing1) n=1 Tax=Aspergillus undulatus TaxID=1810928 RepID=UPI003CCE3CC7